MNQLNMTEIWKPIKGYEGLYEVSNFGQVRSVDRYVRFGRWGDDQTRLRKSKLLSLKEDFGHYRVTLFKESKRKLFFVHRLVAEAFIPNPYNLPVINHKDENGHNNRVDNLEWCTVKYNVNYGTSIKRSIQTKIKNGYINPEHIGLDKKELSRISQREYRKKKRESLV